MLRKLLLAACVKSRAGCHSPESAPGHLQGIQELEALPASGQGCFLPSSAQ